MRMCWNENECLTKWPEMRMVKIAKVAKNKRALRFPWSVFPLFCFIYLFIYSKGNFTTKL